MRRVDEGERRWDDFFSDNYLLYCYYIGILSETYGLNLKSSGGNGWNGKDKEDEMFCF